LNNQQKHFIVKFLSFLFSGTLILTFTANDLEAQRVKEQVLTATYVYQLSKNIHWPNAGNIKAYRFHIIDEDKQVYNELKKISKETQLHGKPIVVSFSDSGDVPDDVHVVYTGEKKADLFEPLSDKVEDQNVLLISHSQKNKRIIMINLFKTPEQKFRFEINKANIINQRLGIEPDIILLGGTEIDVAKLFREAQVSLREQEQLIRQQKKAVLEEKARLEEAVAKTTAQETVIAQQQKGIEEEQQRYSKLALESQEQQEIIDRQKKVVLEEKARFEELSAKAQDQQRIIDRQEKAVLAQKARLEEAVAKTTAQETVIAQQKKGIEEEQQRYSQLAVESQEQQRIIDRQKETVLKEKARFDDLSARAQDQQKIINQQEKAVLAQKARLEEAVAKTAAQEKLIAQQQKGIEKEQRRYSKLAIESQEQQRIIDQQREVVLEEKARIEELSAKAQGQQRIINEQEKAVLAQKARLKETLAKTLAQETIITEQQKGIKEEQQRYSELAVESKEQQKIIEEQGKSILGQKVRLKEAIAITTEQEKIIANQQKGIKEEQQRYSELAIKSKEQQATLDRQKTLFVEERRKYEQLTENVKQRERSLEEQAKKIEERTAILDVQDKKIETQEKVINDQADILANQSATIVSQKNFLYALSAVVILLCGLAYVIYRGYKTKKLTSAQLSEQKQLLQQNADDLFQANEKLKELDRLKSMFIASMSHEFRTPLNSIIGFTGILLMEIVGKLEPKQKDLLKRANQSSKHLLSLITDIIDISKIEAGIIETFNSPFMLGQVIGEAVNNVETIKNNKGLELRVSVPDNFKIYSDRNRVYQCILNYLSNAIKYTEKGSVSISARQLNGEAEIVVEDSGIGIAEKDLPKLFQPFERLDSPLRTKELGTGLGLYLTKKMASEILGGSVRVESQVGVGSRFFLNIPLHLQPKKNENKSISFALEK
jgi:signal transduction histidine kinase